MGSAAGDEPTVPTVEPHGRLPAFAAKLGAVGAPGESRWDVLACFPRGAFEPNDLFLSVQVGEHEPERYCEDDDRQRRQRNDRDQDPSPHGSSKR